MDHVFVRYFFFNLDLNDYLSDDYLHYCSYSYCYKDCNNDHSSNTTYIMFLACDGSQQNKFIKSN